MISYNSREAMRTEETSSYFGGSSDHRSEGDHVSPTSARVARDVLDVKRLPGGKHSNKMTPRAMSSPRSLSLESEELRKVLQKDVREAMWQVLGREVSSLRRDVSLLLSNDQRISPKARGTSSEHPPVPVYGEKVSLGSEPGSESAQRQDFLRTAANFEDALQSFVEAHHHEVGRLRGNLAGVTELLTRVGGNAGAEQQRDPLLATDISKALVVLAASGDLSAQQPHGASGGPRWSHHGDAAEQPTSPNSRRAQTRPGSGVVERTVANEGSDSRGPTTRTPYSADSEVIDFGNDNFKWEWERSNNKGWAEYTPRQSGRIEKAWRNGASRVRVRSGTEGNTPMEIFLVDMVQVDPISGNKRRVRRVGSVPWYRTPQRHARALLNQAKKGEPVWESLEQYKMRQELVLGANLDTMRTRFGKGETQKFLEKKRGKVEAPCRYSTAKIVSGDVFSVVSIFVTILQSIWIGIDVDKNEGKSLYDKSSSDVAVEYFFATFFLAELLLRLTDFSPVKSCWKDFWWCFDLACVVVSGVEVFVTAPLNALTQGGVQEWGGFTALRVLRLAKVFRVARVFGASSDAAPFFKGLLSGMKSAAFVWGLLLAMLYVFGILLRLNAEDTLKEEFFPTVAESMLTLLARGIMLDEVSEILNLMRLSGAWLSLIVFMVFVFCAHFNLLNMLVGSFCSVAGEVAALEKDAAQVEYLRQNLACVVDCYIHNDGLIGKKEFQLIMKNVDVYSTLHDCGTDMEELASLESILFQRFDEIDFDTLFQAVVHLRKGKVATVKDVLQIQDTLGGKLANLEDRIELVASRGHSRTMV